MNGGEVRSLEEMPQDPGFAMLALSPAELHLWGAEANVEFSNCDVGGLRVISAGVSGPNRRFPEGENEEVVRGCYLKTPFQAFTNFTVWSYGWNLNAQHTKHMIKKKTL